MKRTQDLHVRSTVPLIAPRELRQQLPITGAVSETVFRAREAVHAILQGDDRRLLAVVGPCSIHEESVALEYAERLHATAQRICERVLVIMRVYFEKPRTTIGWKGLIYDPYLDGTFDIAAGLRKAREMLLKINGMGLPAATEMLDPITPQYMADLISWASLGARTTESQTHRQMASGLSMPMGYKNGTDGDLDIAIQAMQAARHPHSFLGINADGKTCIVNTTGNPWGHLILRGGRSGPNYDAECVRKASERLMAAGLPPKLMIDCSHGNSGKDARQEAVVWRDAVGQRARGNTHLIGLMLESNLVAGRQSLPADPSCLEYGVSITDPCIGWEETEALLVEAFDALGGS